MPMKNLETLKYFAWITILQLFQSQIVITQCSIIFSNMQAVFQAILHLTTLASFPVTSKAQFPILQWPLTSFQMC